MLAQKKDEMLERLQALYARLAAVGHFAPPAPDADWDALRIYRKRYETELADADILDEIQRIRSGEFFAGPPRDRRDFPPLESSVVREPGGRCLAQEAEEMLERRRNFLGEWAREFHFELPPSSGSWEELREYEMRNASAIASADLSAEVNRILGRYA